MASYKEVYRESYSSGAINAGESAFFGNVRAAQVNRDKHGSANKLIITSLADEDFLIELDGQEAIGILYTRGSFIIDPDDGTFFNSVKITNQSATNAGANEVKVFIARANKEVERVRAS